MIVRHVTGVAIGLLMAASSAVAAPIAHAASGTSSAESKFIGSIATSARAAQNSYGIPASALIAQAINDSSWGSSSVAKTADNYFNQLCSATMSPTEFRNLAIAQVGKPYVLGASASISDPNPPKFDCSELVKWLYGRNNTPISDLAATQYDLTKSVSGAVEPGDLVFLRNNPARSNGIGHVAVITRKLSNGDWEIVEAKGSAYGTVKTTLSYWKTRKYYTGIRRFSQLAFVGDPGVVRTSTSNLFQSSCVTISGVKYTNYSSPSKSFSDRAAHLANDATYKSARAQLPDVSAFIDEVAKVDHPKDAAAWAGKLKELMAQYKLQDYDVVPFNIVLLKATTGAKVTALQYLLRQAGITVPVTGTFDADTFAAVKSFQKANGLEVDGEAGPKTLTALVADLSAGATGNRVAALGALLSGFGYQVDGSTLNAAMTTAVKNVQAAAGMSSTGTVNQNTWAVLFMAVQAATPTISGDPVVDSTLNATATGWGPSGVTLSYQWYREGAPIAGATASTYAVAASDLGAKLSVVVAGSKPSWTTVRFSSAASAAVTAGTLTATPAPTITGTLTAGQTLTAAPGAWGPAPVAFTYQWNRGKTPIRGATAATYTLSGDDAGATVTVTVAGSRPGYTTAAAVSAATGVIAVGTMTPSAPTVTGTPRVGSTLTANTSTWLPRDAAFSYQWLRNKAPIKGATAATYRVGKADLAKTISVSVTAKRKGFKSASARSAATPAVAAAATTPPKATISGAAKVGSKLTATTGNWGSGVSYGFVWKRNGKPITRATAGSYTITRGDLGATLTVTVKGTGKGFRTTSVTSKPTAKVAPGTIAKATAAIKGTPKAGQTLTVVRGTWAPTGVSYRYQWFRNGKAIKAATAATFRLGSADRGKTIKVAVRGSLSGYQTLEKTASVKVR